MTWMALTASRGEDLWDDLAATPSDVPVQDRQKEELARRKANLMS